MNSNKHLADMNLTDNFLFGAAMDNEECGPLLAGTILKTIFQRDIHIKRINPERVILPPGRKLHGVRLDAYIEEESAEVLPGSIYDLEPDNKSAERDQLPRRARFYHSSIDSRLLRSGRNYNELPAVWVIFITTFDPFGEDRMVYTIRNQCAELQEMEYDDGAATLFLYTKGTKGNPPEDLRVLLKYLSDTRPENACTPELSHIQSHIEDIKRDPEVGRQFMDWREYIARERREAVREAISEEKERADAAEERAGMEKERADAAEERADAAEERANAAEAEVMHLRALLKSAVGDNSPFHSD